jgi:voltage-gated potassium channel
MVVSLGTVVIYLTEHGANPDFRTWGDCLWWTIVTMSTVGYGDKVPITFGGRLMASVVMVAGPVLLASFAASVGATFYDEWRKGVKGMAKITSREHIVICGWSATGADVIVELRQSDMFNKSPITVIDGGIDANPSNDSRTSFVHGFPSEVKTLEQANIREARYAIVVAKDKTPAADQQTVLTVLAIKNINPQVYICAELNDANNEGHLRRSGCDTIVNTSSLTSGLLALSLENPVVSGVIRELASFRGNEVYRVKVPDGVAGSRFGDILNDYKKGHDAILIGIEREGKPLLNPSADLELKTSDYLLALSEQCPR